MPFVAAVITIRIFFRLIRCHYLKRSGTGKKAYILVAGFNQPAETWNWYATHVLNQSDTVVILRRRGEKKPAWWIGWMPLWYQKREALKMVKWLLEHDLKNKEVILVGHSLGGLLGRYLVSRLPDQISGLIQIAPVPAKRWAIAFNWSFWKNGGISALPIVILGLFFPLLGAIAPRSAVRGLFAGENIKDKKLDEYFRSLVRDSVILFLALIVWYNGKREWRKTRQTWKGKSVIVHAPADAIIPKKALREMLQSGERLVKLYSTTPHCFWLAPQKALGKNTKILKKTI